MGLHNGNRFILFFILILPAFCFQTANSQTGNWQNTSLSELRSGISDFELETGAETLPEFAGGGKSSEKAFEKLQPDCAFCRQNPAKNPFQDSFTAERKEKTGSESPINPVFERLQIAALQRNEFYANSKKAGGATIKDSARENIDLKTISEENFSLTSPGVQKTALISFPVDTKSPDEPDASAPPLNDGFRWRSAIQQSLLFLAVQHGYALTQPKTRKALKGKFFKDYIDSVKSLRGWEDGGRFFTNYIAHPMQGSFVGFIQIQNDPKGMKQRFGSSADYWRSRMKAFAWSAFWSTQFEIGPISQASIGNVGLSGKQTYVDLVVTPTLGTVMLISEDAIDRFVLERIERKTDNYYLMIFSRMLLNPTRTVANLIRFKLPWHRDRQRAR
jgi:hypothetical protein